jgi:alkanesulfonate monooxygenase SsuD/methylene tetrahydromethanopterin reductase-like flavin-dependent oxidoreductase (luciferase family)
MKYWVFYLVEPARKNVKWHEDYSETDEYESPAEIYRNIIDEAVLAEDLGYEGIWLAEHHFASNYSLSPSPLTLLAAVAERTSRLKLGAGVTCLPEHHPVSVAEEIAVLDHISEGRVDTCIGRGVFPDEYGGLGVPIAESHERYAEGLELLHRLFNETDVIHEGKAWQCLAPVTLAPGPYQEPHPPLWLAANSLTTISIALDNGMDVVFNVGVFGVERLTEFREGFDAECEKREVDSSSVRFGAQVWAHYAPTQERVEKAAQAARVVIRAAGRRVGAPRQYTKDGIVDLRAPTEATALGDVTAGDFQYTTDDGEASTEDILATNMIGDADRIRHMAKIYEDLGVTDLILIMDTGDITPAERRETMREIASILDVTAAAQAGAA